MPKSSIPSRPSQGVPDEVSEALAKAARELADGRTCSDTSRDFLNNVRGQVELVAETSEQDSGSGQGTEEVGFDFLDVLLAHRGGQLIDL